MTWLDDASSMSILLLTTSLSAVAAYIIYMRFWHPLAHCPGPFIASLTNLWSAKMSVDGDWPHRMDTLHAQYGPVVRIAPNEVCIDEPEAIPAICMERLVTNLARIWYADYRIARRRTCNGIYKDEFLSSLR